MHRFTTLIAFATLLALTFAASSSAKAQEWVPGKYMAQALGEMMGAVRAISNDTNWGYDGSGVCLTGTLLSKGEAYALNRHFEAGERYAILASGDEDAKDVDVEILDNRGNRLARDNDADRAALAIFVPRTRGTYTIRMKLYDSHRNAFCVFAVLRERGFDVPVTNLTAAAVTFIERCGAVHQLARKEGGGAEFLARPNQAAVCGVILRGGNSTTLTNIDLGNTSSIILSAGDRQSNDVDLHLLDNQGLLIKEDVLPDNNPVITFRPNFGSRYQIKATNASRGGNASLIMFGVLHVR